MDQVNDHVPAKVERTLDLEIGLVRDAIALVARGASPRVTVAGLRLSAQLLGPARELAAGVGLHVTPLWHTDEDGLDIVIEREAR
jgi:hypothetical protein